MLKNRSFQIIVFFLCGLTFQGCTYEGVPEAGSTENNCDPTSSFNYIVDVGNGIDLLPYSPEYGFRTITYALNYLDTLNGLYGYNVCVKEGVYDESHGELFPIRVNEKISLNADYGVEIINNGLSIVEKIDGYELNSPVTFIVDNGGKVNNFFIVGNSQGVGIISRSGLSYIYNNEIKLNKVGLLTMNDSTPLIFKNSFFENELSLDLKHFSRPDLYYNVVNNNKAGVLVSGNAQPNFGDIDRPGQNYLGERLDYGFCNTTDNLINAVGNYYSGVEGDLIISQTCADGVLVGNTSRGGVLLNKYSTSDINIFNADADIELLSPSQGEIIYSDTPQFSWNMESRELVALGVFDNRIEVKDNEILNTDDLVFYWDSGMLKGLVGSISLDDGVRFISGERSSGKNVIPLEKGKAYFWAVWSWDNEGIKIVSSSIEGYFILLN
jgi:hypothetical protein